MQKEQDKLKKQFKKNVYSLDDTEQIVQNALNKSSKENEKKISEDIQEKMKQKWNYQFDGISTKKTVKNFLNFLCEFDLEFAFNNKYSNLKIKQNRL